ncbi:hypothetical protein [Mycolicibacter heraklionensis]|nr:hypothetical protein [Mycolicibacter heraklionensis]
MISDTDLDQLDRLLVDLIEEWMRAPSDEIGHMRGRAQEVARAAAAYA